MRKLGLAFEVEYVRPAESEWELIVRCVGGLPDNFGLQSGDLPPYFERSTVNAHVVRRCKALDDSTRDRFGNVRVDMVGLCFTDARAINDFRAGQRVSWAQEHEPDLTQWDGY